MHNAALRHGGINGVYVPFEVQPDDIAAAVAGVRALGIRGVNVTVPHKEAVVPFLDALTPEAERLGAVNTLYWENGLLCGDTTDGRGYIAALRSEGLVPEPGSTVVVLGAGGSARSVVSALSDIGCKVIVANRTLAKAEGLLSLGASAIGDYDSTVVLEALAAATLVVNTTTLGMSPNVGVMPDIDVATLQPSCVVSDLIYRPDRTELQLKAEARGLRVQNGLEMLVQQGALSFERWLGVSAPVHVMRQAVQESIQGGVK
jgi:shikimate dehydrogenase